LVTLRWKQFPLTTCHNLRFARVRAQK
jgi:hypothetical protein